MDVKGAFDHVPKGQLLTHKIELGVDGDLVTWTGSFLTDRKVQFVIDGHDNKERKIETGIPQGSPALWYKLLFTEFKPVNKANSVEFL